MSWRDVDPVEAETLRINRERAAKVAAELTDRVDEISAEEWGKYATTCELYPGDVVRFNPWASGEEPKQEWVIQGPPRHVRPIGYGFVYLVAPGPDGTWEEMSASDRSLLRLVWRGGGQWRIWR